MGLTAGFDPLRNLASLSKQGVGNYRDENRDPAIETAPPSCAY